jgi:hypothetical protein
MQRADLPPTGSIQDQDWVLPNPSDACSKPPSSEDQWHLLREGLQIGAILMDETAGWAMLYRPRDIHAG